MLSSIDIIGIFFLKPVLQFMIRLQVSESEYVGTSLSFHYFFVGHFSCGIDLLALSIVLMFIMVLNNVIPYLRVAQGLTCLSDVDERRVLLG